MCEHRGASNAYLIGAVRCGAVYGILPRRPSPRRAPLLLQREVQGPLPQAHLRGYTPNSKDDLVEITLLERFRIVRILLMILINDPYLFFPHRQTFFSPPMCPRTPSSITLNHRMTYIFLVFESLGYVQDGVLRVSERDFIFCSCRCAADRSSTSSSTTFL